MKILGQKTISGKSGYTACIKYKGQYYTAGGCGGQKDIKTLPFMNFVTILPDPNTDLFTISKTSDNEKEMDVTYYHYEVNQRDYSLDDWELIDCKYYYY